MPKKTYQEQMQNSYPDYPIVKPIPTTMVKSWGEGMTAKALCVVLAKKHKVDIACPYTTGILMNIVARAIEEDESDDIPMVANCMKQR